MKRGFFQSIASFFGLLCVVFIPFPFNITKVQLSITDFLFGGLIRTIANIFGNTLKDTRVYSDSSSMYILVLLLFLLAVIISAVLLQVKKWELYRNKFFGFVYRLLLYYLALQLLKYGVDKIFKNQFYLPEPNTLYTPLGQVSKDLLYWSSMGTSHFYNVFMGSLEALAAIFILVKKTRLTGLLMSLVILLNVVAVNFGFDIDVKLYSLFLVYVTAYLLVPYCSRLYQLLLTRAPGRSFPAPAPVFRRNFLSVFFKWLIAGLIFLEAFYPFISTGNFNGDLAKRPYLHGAYDVRQMITGTDTLSDAGSPIKRFFIHREGFMIFQDREDRMQDYKLTYSSSNKLIITDYQKNETELTIRYDFHDSILVLQYNKANKLHQLTGKAIDWKKLPALQKGFRWMMDAQ